MAEIKSYKPGEFCWFELATTDQNDAKKFYTNLFGWSIDDQPMGPGQVYTMLQKQGKNAGALFGMGPDEASKIPPHWQVYIAVEDVDKEAARAKGLGATVVMEPFDVMDVGRMALIQDPTGAMFSIWRGTKHHGADVVDETNAFCWYELSVNDLDKAKDFYTKFFGWGTKVAPEYTEWQNHGRSIGGLMKIDPAWGPVPPNWMACVMVDDIDGKVETAKSTGGQSLMGPFPIGEMGRYAVMKDPQGAVFSIFEPTKKA